MKSGEFAILTNFSTKTRSCYVKKILSIKRYILCFIRVLSFDSQINGYGVFRVIRSNASKIAHFRVISSNNSNYSQLSYNAMTGWPTQREQQNRI